MHVMYHVLLSEPKLEEQGLSVERKLLKNNAQEVAHTTQGRIYTLSQELKSVQ